MSSYAGIHSNRSSGREDRYGRSGSETRIGSFHAHATRAPYPKSVGLPKGPARRTPGLQRDEGRLLPREFPPCGTVYHYFQAWQTSGVWVHLHRVLYEQARRHAGRAACPSVVIMDGQSVKTTERGGARGFDAHKRVKGRKRHILVDTLGLLVASRVEPADTSDRRAGALLLGGLKCVVSEDPDGVIEATNGHLTVKFSSRFHEGEAVSNVRKFP